MNENQVVKGLKRNNWIMLGILTVAGMVLWNPFFGISVLIGGLLIIANFHLLYRILCHTLNPRALKSPGLVVFSYYLRLAAMGLIMFVLMLLGWVTPLGLLLGLSTVVLNLMVCGFFAIKRASVKEA